MTYQARVYIIGDVVGVGFRAWTKLQNKSLKVNGWIRNNHQRPEVFGSGGGVEAVFQGTQGQIMQMITLVKQGPSVARVDEVEVMWEKPKEIYEDFEIVK